MVLGVSHIGVPAQTTPVLSDDFSNCTPNGILDGNFEVGGGLYNDVWGSQPTCAGWSMTGPVFLAQVTSTNSNTLTTVGDKAIWLNEEAGTVSRAVSGAVAGVSYRIEMLIWNDDQPYDTGLNVTIGSNSTVSFPLEAGTSGGPRIVNFCFVSPSNGPLLTLAEGGDSPASPVISSLAIYEETEGNGCAAPPPVCDLADAITFSQGDWSPNSAHPPLTPVLFSTKFPSGLVLGRTGYSVTLTSVDAVRSFLPQGGNVNVFFPGNRTDPARNSPKNLLAGQTAAAMLNLALRPGLGGARLRSGKGLPLEGTSVADVVGMANDALGYSSGVPPTKRDLSRLADALDYVNRSFPRGVDRGILFCASAAR